jgi:DNA-3-methyladenine glycosylase II
MNSSADAYRKAQRLLSRRDPVLRQLMKAVGPCTLLPDSDGFKALARAIIAQQISTKAAASIFARLGTELAADGLTPAAILAASEEQLRGVGLSRGKALAVLDLAGHVHDGRLPIHDLHHLSDDEVVSLLVPVRGIGAWTAQMFLIFSMGRMDVLPVDDLGLRAGVQTVYGLPELPDRAALRERAEAWRPYRSIATWYFWRSRGFVPQSDKNGDARTKTGPSA